ncbi:MAG: peptidoglycan-binding domain-containing protein [Acidobacteriaceae bacterium]
MSHGEGSRTMRVSFWKVLPAGLLLLAVPGFASIHPKAGSSKRHYHASVRHVSEAHRRSWHMLPRHHESAPVEMPAERATEIQTALIKQGYMSGEPTGTWDAQTVAAMKKLQGDNGWQTKITPDSRALIKLGLGPNDEGAGAVPAAAATSGAGAGGAADSNTSLAQTQPQ